MGRCRSLWGWGYEDRYAHTEKLTQLGELVALWTGIQTTAPQSPVPLAESVLSPSRAQVPETLTSVLCARPEDRARHTYGCAYVDIVRGFRGDFEGAPDLVAYPADEGDVRRVLDFCQEHDFAVVPFGGGTSVVRGVECAREAKGSVVSLDLGRLNRLQEVSPQDHRARFQAGVLGPALEDALRPHGMTLRHFPQSFEFSSLGGWVATRAGGHFATLYTRIDDFVASVRMLSPSGELVTLDVPSTGAGPEPKRWVLGSEGAFGVITEATVRVRPRALYRGRVTVRFERFEDGVRACRELAGSDLYPSNCRLLDPVEATFNRVDQSGQAILLLAFESVDHPVDAWVERGLEIAQEAGGTPKEPARIFAPGARFDAAEATDVTEGPDTAASWKAAFLDAPYLQSQLVTLGVLADTFETCTTWSRFEALDAALRERLAPLLRVNGRDGILTRRFTHVYPDGPAPYYTFLTQASPGGERSQWADIKAASLEVLAQYGATVTHHHAVGRTHRAAYHDELGPTGLALLRGAKSAIDPGGIMNPGVLV